MADGNFPTRLHDGVIMVTDDDGAIDTMGSRGRLLFGSSTGRHTDRRGRRRPGRRHSPAPRSQVEAPDLARGGLGGCDRAAEARLESNYSRYTIAYDG